MDVSAFKELTLNDSDTHVAKPNRRHIGRIIVSGYDVKLPHDDLESALRNHFASCGEITDIYIRLNTDNTLNRYTYIYFMGEGAAERALQLGGSDVGGWNVITEAFPFPKDAGCSPEVAVQGYDTSLSKIELEDMLSKHFSSCGEVEEVVIHERIGAARVSVYGEDAEYKVLELNGSYMGGRKLLVKLFGGPGIYSVHMRRRRGRILTQPGEKTST